MAVGNCSAFYLLLAYLEGNLSTVKTFKENLREQYFMLFVRSRHEVQRCAIFLGLAKSAFHLRAMKRSRGRVVRETSRGGHRRLLRLVVNRLSVMAQDIAGEPGLYYRSQLLNFV